MTGNRDRSSTVEILLLLVILAAGFAVRVYDLKDPPLDFHATRQLRSAILSRAFYYQDASNADLSLVSQSKTLAQLETYEPPIMEWLVSRVNLMIGQDVFWTGRIFSAFFWSLGGLFLYLIVQKLASGWSGLISLLIYFFLPMSVIMSRSFQPDPWMCCWVIVFAWSCLRWTGDPSWGNTALCGMLGAIAILSKLFAVFFVAIMFLGALLGMVRKPDFAKTLLKGMVAGIIMVTPAFIYYLLQNTDASASFWSTWVVSLSGLIGTGEFYARWIAMIKGITGLILPLLAICGVILMETRYFPVFTGWWVGVLIFGLVFPYQTITHEYYSLILIPLVAISVAPILQLIVEKAATSRKWTQYGIGIAVSLAAFYGAYAAMGTLRATDYGLEPASWRKVADAIPQDELFIALTGDYGMRLNYFGWRSPSRMWPDANDVALATLQGKPQEGFESFFAAQTEGMKYFLITADTELARQPLLQQALERFPIYREGNGFKLYNLSELSAP
ncbi:MAG: hypothetical protein GX933_01610 [Chloroflexi bacterium]|nr:hypothetical protein [Chloroflexota bacterium]